MLEIGCGPGVAAALVCERLTTGRMLAVDRSPVAVERTARRNAAHLASSRLTVQQRELAALTVPTVVGVLARLVERVLGHYPRAYRGAVGWVPPGTPTPNPLIEGSADSPVAGPARLALPFRPGSSPLSGRQYRVVREAVGPDTRRREGTDIGEPVDVVTVFRLAEARRIVEDGGLQNIEGRCMGNLARYHGITKTRQVAST